MKLISWNVSSMKTTTFESIREIQPHIMCLQEVRLYPFRNSPAFNYVHKARTTNTQGGGICIGIDTKINYRTLDHLIPPEIDHL
jgi:exonuclease III